MFKSLLLSSSTLTFLLRLSGRWKTLSLSLDDSSWDLFREAFGADFGAAFGADIGAAFGADFGADFSADFGADFLRRRSI